jgi:hypothetical protein
VRKENEMPPEKNDPRETPEALGRHGIVRRQAGHAPAKNTDSLGISVIDTRRIKITEE